MTDDTHHGGSQNGGALGARVDNLERSVSDIVSSVAEIRNLVLASQKTPNPRSREFSVFINADVALETSDPDGEKLFWPLSQAFKAAGLTVAKIEWETVPHGHLTIVIPPKITWKDPGTHPPGGP